MKSLSVLLAQWHPAGERVPVGGEASALAAAWHDAVGEDVARRTRTAGFRDGTLTVITPSSAWSHQLTFLVPTILQRLSEQCPGVGLRALRFIVATGRSRALLAHRTQQGRSHKTRRGALRGGASFEGVKAARGVASSASEHVGAVETRDSDEPAVWLARLRSEQARLDRRRLEEGWQRCRSCGSWSPADVCAPCAQAQQRANDGRVAQLIAAAPWLRFEEHARHSPALDVRAYARVRRSLLLQWERQMQDARGRLRRAALDPADRIVAWSYLMLALHTRQDEVSPAVLAATVGRRWADALLDAAAPRTTMRSRKAQRQSREK